MKLNTISIFTNLFIQVYVNETNINNIFKTLLKLIDLF